MAEIKRTVPVTIKQANYVFSWNFKAEKDDETSHSCKLCKRALLAPPLQELQVNNNNDIKLEGRLAMGRCGDIFHEKCIASSLSSGCVSCPTCNVPWQQAKILRSVVSSGNIEDLTVKKKTQKQSNQTTTVANSQA